MSIEKKVRLVEGLFEELDLEIAKFQSHTGLHCLSGCGKCCTKPDIDASPLEFLPWAFHIFLSGKAHETLKKIKENPSSICHIYAPLSPTDTKNGSCSNYSYRGLICRLFGYATSRDKHGQRELVTCMLIKENQNDNYNLAVKDMQKGLHVPVFSDYYMRLAQIDFKLANIVIPINEALKMALEEVLHYYAYRPLPNNYNAA